MKKLRVLDLFSGIGGFSLGLERTGGFETVAFCEIEPFPRRVLAKHWPEIKCYEDVRVLTADILRRDGITVDVICGGFPCQDISTAGSGEGLDGARSGLWSEISRLVGELRPQFVIVENVSNLISGPTERPGAWFSKVLGDLAALGYDAEWHCISARAIGAPHRRDRVWIVANPNGIGRLVERAGSVGNIGQAQSRAGNGCATLADAVSIRQSGQGKPWYASYKAPCITREAIDAVDGRIRDLWSTEPNVGRVADGVPDRAHRLKSLGNAVVPQIPELIGLAILESMRVEAAA